MAKAESLTGGPFLRTCVFAVNPVCGLLGTFPSPLHQRGLELPQALAFSGSSQTPECWLQKHSQHHHLSVTVTFISVPPRLTVSPPRRGVRYPELWEISKEIKRADTGPLGEPRGSTGTHGSVPAMGEEGATRGLRGTHEERQVRHSHSEEPGWQGKARAGHGQDRGQHRNRRVSVLGRTRSAPQLRLERGQCWTFSPEMSKS